jgi:hypothetical protein
MSRRSSSTAIRLWLSASAEIPACFEWIGQLGDLVGDVFTEIDFSQVDAAALIPVERSASGASF